MKLVFALAAICISSSAGLAQAVTCTGTEPFWNLTINDRQIHFSSPESSFDMQPTEPNSARGMAQDYVLVYQTKASTDAAEPVTIILQKPYSSQCSDGMSDVTYSYFGVVVTPRAVFAGCCRTK